MFLLEDIPPQDRVVISETSKTPLIQNGEVVVVLGIVLDVTARKMIENQVKQAKLDLAAESLGLTKKERQCAEYLLLGKTAPEIAKILYLSPRTIECHIEHIKNKLGCSKNQNSLQF